VKSIAEADEIDPVSSRLPTLGQAERESGSVIERLIPGRNEGRNLRADTLLQSVFARAEGLAQLLFIQTREPLVAVRVAGDFMTRIVNASNLRRIMIWTLAGKGGRADHSEAGRHAITGVDLE